jgi:hypothetical protein
MGGPVIQPHTLESVHELSRYPFRVFLQLQTYIGTLITAIIQVVALLSYLFAYFP